MSKHALTADFLRKILHYDPETGILTRLKASGTSKIGNVAGCLHHSGYLRLKINSRGYAAHRVIWLYMTGSWPANEIDHINRNKSDNRWVNLRGATHYQNQGNTAVRKNNQLGIKGVSRNPYGKYKAQIRLDGKMLWLGTFKTAAQAKLVYDEAAKKHYGDFFSEEKVKVELDEKLLVAA